MRKRKILVWSFLALLTAIILLFVFRERLILSFIFKDFHPRNPKNQIETTHNIGWWAYQDNIKVDSFSVTLIESKLNLFNSESLIGYKIKGNLTGKAKWKPFVKTVHLSERFLRNYNRELHPYLDNDTCQIPEAIIEITPVVGIKEIQSYNGESIPFEFKNELKIQSFHWGNNWLRLQCGSLKTDIILHQRK